MSDQHRELLLRVAELRQLVDAATLTPWTASETKNLWTLQGQAREFKGKGQAPSMQIAKAPKNNSPHPECWPNVADTVMIIESANRMSFWLDLVDGILARHYPVLCGCKVAHFLCSHYRAYPWEECPEVIAVTRAIEKLHG